MERIFALLLVSAVLASCATLNKDECNTADWYQIGYEDGLRGYAASRITLHREACAKHGLRPDFEAYRAGHDDGVVGFCTPRNGFEQAKSGYTYTGICPADREPGFLRGYDAGREFFVASTAVSRLENELRVNESRMQGLRESIAARTAVMLSDDTPVEERYRINQQIAELQRSLVEAEQRNRAAINALAEARRELQLLQSDLGVY